MNRFEQLRSQAAGNVSETYLFRRMEPKTNRLRQFLSKAVPETLHALGQSEPVLLIVQKAGEYAGIKPEGRRNFVAMIRKMRERKKIRLSEHIGVTRGYKLDIEFCDLHIEEPLEKGVVWTSNYPSEKGILNSPSWLTPLESYTAKRTTGKELVWALSYGDKQHKPNEFIGAIHELVEETIGAVMVGDPKNPTKGGIMLVRKLLRGDALGIYLEGEPSAQLKKADHRAGHLVLQAAERDINTIAVAVWKGKNAEKKDTLFMKHAIIKPSTIAKLKSFLIDHGYTDEEEINQQIGDYIMRVIASHMPETKVRGYYMLYDEEFSEEDIEERRFTSLSFNFGKGSGVFDPLLWAFGKE